MLSSDFARRVSRESTEAFNEGLEQNLPSATPIFDVRGSTNPDERLVGMRGFPLHGNRSAEDASYTVMEAVEGDSKLLTHVEYLNGYWLSAKSDRHLPSEDAANLGRQLALSAQYTIDYIMWAVVSGGFATTTTADGQYLFSDTHALEGGGTYDNKGTTALDYAAFWVAWGVLQQVPTAEGLIAPRQASYLVVPPELYETAIQIVSSAYTDKELQTNVVNSTQNLSVLVNPLATDANDWFLATMPYQGGLTTFMEVAPDLEFDFVQANRTYVWNTLFSLSAGAADWRGYFGASVT
jgi:hypothetical protein